MPAAVRSTRGESDRAAATRAASASASAAGERTRRTMAAQRAMACGAVKPASTPAARAAALAWITAALLERSEKQGDRPAFRRRLGADGRLQGEIGGAQHGEAHAVLLSAWTRLRCTSKGSRAASRSRSSSKSPR